MGAVGRWALGEAWPVPADGFPWTTFAVNVVGSGALALLPAWAVVRRHALLAPALGTGVLGGFTTLSTASEETRALLAGGHAATAAAYVLGTLGASLLAVALAGLLSTPDERGLVEAEEGDL